MTAQTRAADLEAFDQTWLEMMEETPFVRVIIALSGLTRLGERPVSLERLAAVVEKSVAETEALVRRDFVARIEDGLIHWDDPYPGEQTRRVLHIGDREVTMGSGCGPDLFTFAALFDVPFRVEENCPTTGTPITVDFVPDGVARVDPPEAVTMLLSPDELSQSVETFQEANDNACSYQPLFASAEAAEPWRAAHPGSRVFTIQEMLQRPWYTFYRDLLRPRIHPSSSDSGDGDRP